MSSEITNEDIIRRIEQTELLMEDVKRLSDIRTTALKVQIDGVITETREMVAAFEAAKGAFQVLEWLAKVAKPIIVIVGAIGAGFLYLKGLR